MPDDPLPSPAPDRATDPAGKSDGDYAEAPEAPSDKESLQAEVLSGALPPDEKGRIEASSETSDADVEGKPQPRSSISRALATWGPTRRLSWYRATRREALGDSDIWRRHDREKNDRGRLPDGERVELPVMWVAELYTPSTVPGLFDGISELGWEYGRTRSESLAKWMSEVRQGRRAGWTSLGLVSADSRSFMRERTATLPDGVTAALPILMSITPSLTAFVIGFIMSEKSADSFDTPLRAYYATRTERDPRFRRRHIISHILWNGPMHSGRRIFNPDLVRRDEVRTRLQELEARCTRGSGRECLARSRPDFAGRSFLPQCSS